MAELSGGMTVGVLGPLEVSVDGRPVELVMGRSRTLLAVLALSAGKVVSVDRLAAAMWDGDLPANVRRSVQTHLYRLRGALGADLIGTTSAGYVLNADPDRVDALRFLGLVDAAARVSDPASRLGLLTEALGLWRGNPFEGVPSNWLRRSELPRLQERYLSAVEQRIDMEVAERRYGGLVAKLSELTARYPLRESLWVRLLVVLQRSGRQAEALERYEVIRARLADELGADPGPELREIFADLLAGAAPAPRLDRPAPAAASALVPQQLPPAVDGFVGRQAALQALNGLVDDGGGRAGGAVVISAIAGTAGVGKTALALHWAHQVAHRFPDGQLYVNLRGYDPDQPMAPADALTGFLSALGVTGQDVPHALDERAARYRSELADRRMLVVLDNAGSVEQVRPLLPGSSSSMVVVTSRDSLAGLVAVDGARRLELDLLPPAEAITLLRRLVGPRIDAEPEAAATLIEQSARLPLALRVVAELAASRPTVPPAELVDELRDQRRRLDLLDGGDPYAAVRTVFSWSIRHLPPAAAGTFRLLGLHPGTDIDPYAVAALGDTSLEDARRRVALLVRAHLVQSSAPGRYGMHDLLRAYAAELVRADNAESVRSAARARLLDYYRHTASVAMDTAYPYERERRPRVPPVDTPTPDLSEPDQARGWLDVERPNLLAAARFAADHGLPQHTLDLSTVLHRHLRTRGRYGDAEALHHLALTTASTIGDRTSQLTALTGLGWAHLLQSQYERAVDRFGQALAFARATGGRAGELDALTGLGQIRLLQGLPELALDHYQQALDIARGTGHRSGELNALNGLGHVHRLRSQHERAVDHYQQALEIARATGHRVGELAALNGLAHIYRLQGQHEQAADHNQQALDIARATGHRDGVPAALIGLARSHLRQGRHEQAVGHYRQSLDLALETGDRNWQFEALQGLGRIHHATGDPATALAHHRQALQLATELGQPADQARALDGLAHAHHALNQPAPARQHWQQALDILTSLGTDHTEDPETSTTAIRAQLAALAAR